MDEFQELGFENEAEFYRMVARVDLSSPHKISAFKKWQEDDGSKSGLQKLSDQTIG